MSVALFTLNVLQFPQHGTCHDIFAIQAVSAIIPGVDYRFTRIDVFWDVPSRTTLDSNNYVFLYVPVWEDSARYFICARIMNLSKAICGLGDDRIMSTICSVGSPCH